MNFFYAYSSTGILSNCILPDFMRFYRRKLFKGPNTMCTYISISNTWLREYNSIMLSMWEDMIRRLYFHVRISECAFYAFIIFLNASLPRIKNQFYPRQSDV